MSRPWFRMYAEFVTDPKVQLLSFDDQRHFIMLLCLKCNGTLDSATPSPEFRDRMISRALGLDPASASEAKRRLVEVGLISADWQPLKWNERQYESDSSAARTRAWRERHRSVTSQERHSDVTVTDKNRTDTEQNRTDSRRAASGEPEVPESLDKALFAEARNVFGKSAGGLTNRAIRVRGKPWLVDVIERCRSKDPEAARAYLAAALAKPKGPDRRHPG